ncbi:hypothetical protein [Methanococcus maripaludis]|uniref:Uncharacterized protein n=1 Tax=Methanococcus maripaludis TaxID=39152 RepID=A0A7J9S1R9_METMI|nr:hypothetical protein [Methanococcus maripaludis]MBB6067884.1 hypothetical protein [Methanococcus maripaludis]
MIEYTFTKPNFELELFDRVLSIDYSSKFKELSNVLENMKVASKKYFKYIKDAIGDTYGKFLDYRVLYSFIMMLKFEKSYETTSERFKNAAIITAFISYVSLKGKLKKIIIKKGDDSYPKIELLLKEELPVKEEISLLNKVLDEVWSMGKSYSDLRYSSIVIN